MSTAEHVETRSPHVRAAELGLRCLGFDAEVGGSGGDLLDTVVLADGTALPHVVNGATTSNTSGTRADVVTTAVRTGGPGHGRPLLARQSVRHTRVEMRARIELARAFTRDRAVRVHDGAEDLGGVCAAKNTAGAAADFVVDKAVQRHGGMGSVRDARILPIGGGATEVMTDLAATRWGW